MTLFTEDFRSYDPATYAAVDLLLLEIAKTENLYAEFTLDLKEVKPLTVLEWEDRCKELSRDFVFALSMFADKYPKEWQYLYGTSLTSKVLEESYIKIFNINMNPT
jgi:hypothetical protein